MSPNSETTDPLQELRVWLIRVILWSLGAAAVVGVLSVLTGFYSVGWRTCGTAVLTALAAGALWGVGEIDERHRMARIVGVATSLLSYVLLLLPIWSIGSEEYLVPTGFATAGCGAVAVVSLILSAFARTTWTGRLGVVVAPIWWLLAMLMIWVGSTGSHFGELLFAFAGYVTLAALCLIGLRALPWDPLRWAGVLISANGFGLTALEIVGAGIVREQTLFALTALAVFVVHTNLVLLADLPKRFGWLVWGTIGAAAITVLTLDLILLTDGGGEIVQRVAAAASILASIGSLAIVLLRMFVWKSRRAEAMPALTSPDPVFIVGDGYDEVSLTCPRCGETQTVSVGDARCRECQLGIAVTISTDDVVEV